MRNSTDIYARFKENDVYRLHLSNLFLYVMVKSARNKAEMTNFSFNIFTSQRPLGIITLINIHSLQLRCCLNHAY